MTRNVPVFYPGQFVSLGGAMRVVALVTPTHVITTRGEWVPLARVSEAPCDSESGAERMGQLGSAIPAPRAGFAGWAGLFPCIPLAA